MTEAQTKPVQNLKLKPIGILMEEIEEISEGLIERLFEEEDKIDYQSFYSRQEQLCNRIKEIFSRNEDQRNNYYQSLKTKLKIAIEEENFLGAAELKKKADYFYRGFIRIPGQNRQKSPRQTL